MRREHSLTSRPRAHEKKTVCTSLVLGWLDWCWRGELNPNSPLKTRKLLILRGRKTAQNAKSAPVGHV